MTDLLVFFNAFFGVAFAVLAAVCDVRVVLCDTSFNGRDDFRLALVLATAGVPTQFLAVFS